MIGLATVSYLQKSDLADGSVDHEDSAVVRPGVGGVDEEALAVGAIVQRGAENSLRVVERDFDAAALSFMMKDLRSR